MSAANAAIEHAHDLLLGTPEGEFVSVSVMSKGDYGVTEGICYSFPVKCKNGDWEVVTGLTIDEFSQSKMKATEQELLEERKEALGI